MSISLHVLNINVQVFKCRPERAKDTVEEPKNRSPPRAFDLLSSLLSSSLPSPAPSSSTQTSGTTSSSAFSTALSAAAGAGGGGGAAGGTSLAGQPEGPSSSPSPFSPSPTPSLLAVDQSCMLSAVVRNSSSVPLTLTALQFLQAADGLHCRVDVIGGGGEGEEEGEGKGEEGRGGSRRVCVSVGKAESRVSGRSTDSLVQEDISRGRDEGSGLVDSSERSLELSLGLVLSPRDSVCFLFRLTPKLKARSLLLGSLRLTWHRSGGKHQQSEGISATLLPFRRTDLRENTSELDESSHSNGGNRMSASEGDGAGDSPPSLPAWQLPVRSEFSLPSVSVQQAVMTAALRLPKFVSVGVPFSISLCLCNSSAVVQELTYQVNRTTTPKP